MANGDASDTLQSCTATMNGRDVLQLCSRIVVAEDMHSTFPRSAIYISNDSHYEMQEALAGQPISISVQPKSGPALTVSHVVHSAKPSMRETGKGLRGAIFGVSEDFKKSIQTRIKKSWSKTNVDSIIKEATKDFKFKTEVTPGLKQASMNGMSQLPLQVVEKAGKLSGAGSDGRGFLFQTHEAGGKTHFRTLKDMTSKGPKATFNYNAAASSSQDSPADDSVIYDLHYEGSSIATAKQTEAQGQRYNPSYSKTGKNDRSSQGSTTPGLGAQGGSATVAYPTVNTVEQDKEKRQVDREQQNLNKYSAKLKILTNLQSGLHVGDVIQVNSGSATHFDDSSPTNSASGKWLITAIMHSIEPGGGPSAGHTGRSVIHCIGKIS